MDFNEIEKELDSYRNQMKTNGLLGSAHKAKEKSRQLFEDQGIKPLLTLQFNSDTEGVFVYCSELDIYTSGSNKDEAERKFILLLFEYYDTLFNNQEDLDEIMQAHLEFYEHQLFPEIFHLLNEYPRYAKELKKRFQSPERQVESWQKVTSSNLVKLSLA
ncbi:MAG: hypothetical protein QME81_16675 [bacterium]|nr:hypothetical protein [bacterium]